MFKFKDEAYSNTISNLNYSLQLKIFFIFNFLLLFLALFIENDLGKNNNSNELMKSEPTNNIVSKVFSYALAYATLAGYVLALQSK
jgi:hypothetical protein